ncbi:MAG TPA: CoA-transferase [Kribbella sp.]
MVAQGNFTERIRAGGAGIGALFTPTGYGTPLCGRPDYDFPQHSISLLSVSLGDWI